jgi:hypothetical protein
MRKQSPRQRCANRRQEHAATRLVSVTSTDDPKFGHAVREVYTAVRDGRTTAAKVVALGSGLPPLEKAFNAAVVAAAQGQILERYRKELVRSQVSLSAPGAWEFLYDHLRESIDFGVEDTFRHLVFQAAGTFADVRMLRVTRRHGPR